ncbi:DUF5719 family protein [uncultured Agrococcus sp.]|uniref:DUF5719 family protein n=1 Tax=uncultured Agrococcus sp. TaxID=382258 RepID=UPI0025F9BB45|nr:DUF5719 family protein [uncultured Agrococcus sp.]
MTDERHEQPDDHERPEHDSWDDAGASVVTEGDLEQGRSPARDSQEQREEGADPDPVALAMDTEHADDVTATDSEAKWNEEAEREQRANRSKTIALWSSRSLVGVAAIAATVALGFGSVWAFGETAPSHIELRETERLAPQSGTQQLVCPPQQVRVGVPGDAEARSLVGDGEAAIPEFEDAAIEQIPLEGVEDAELTVVSAPSTSETIAGVSVSDVGSSEIQGIGAEACSSPTWSQWLVGGSTATGRQTSIVLANPGEQQARVTLDIFGAEGPVSAAANSGVVIDPGTAEVVDLASISVGNAAPAVRVTSEGGPVAAFLQQTTIRTLDPGGIDTTGATVAVSGEQTFLGIPIAAGHTHLDDEQHVDAGPVLRLLPDGDNTEAEVTFASDDGDPITTTLNLTDGRVTELPLEELGEGVYAITVESEVPVAAGVRFTPTEGASEEDFAWMAPSRTIDGEVRFELPLDDEGLRLHVMNSSDEEQTFTIGEEERVLAPGQVVSLTPPGGEVLLSGDGLRASVTYEPDGRAAGFPVQPSPTAAGALHVEY